MINKYVADNEYDSEIRSALEEARKGRSLIDILSGKEYSSFVGKVGGRLGAVHYVLEYSQNIPSSDNNLK